MLHYYEQPFSYEMVNELLSNGFAVDGRQGGLILGRSHDEGGIYFLCDYGIGYRLMGEVEGYEYVFNIATTYLARNIFDELNDFKRDEDVFVEYEPEQSIRVIDTRLPPNSPYLAKYILFDSRGHFSIINKHSAKKNLKNIDEANQAYTYEYDSNDFFAVNKVRILHAGTLQLIENCTIDWDKLWK